MTEFRTYATAGRVGRKKLWDTRLTLPLEKETVDRLDAARREGEDRLAIIREGIELALTKREDKAKRPKKP